MDQLIIAPISDWDYIKKLGGEGILRRSDIADLKNQRARVLYLMLDGGWYFPDQIIAAAGGRAGMRRMRELREIPNVTIERVRSPFTKRDFMYRLKYAPGLQGEIFQ